VCGFFQLRKDYFLWLDNAAGQTNETALYGNAAGLNHAYYLFQTMLFGYARKSINCMHQCAEQWCAAASSSVSRSFFPSANPTHVVVLVSGREAFNNTILPAFRKMASRLLSISSSGLFLI